MASLFRVATRPQRIEISAVSDIGAICWSTSGIKTMHWIVKVCKGRISLADEGNVYYPQAKRDIHKALRCP